MNQWNLAVGRSIYKLTQKYNIHDYFFSRNGHLFNLNKRKKIDKMQEHSHI